MNTVNFSPPWSDEAIVAWLDGELSSADAQRFEQDLDGDPRLAERVASLRHHSDLAQAFAPLLQQAPQQRMEQRLAAALSPVKAASSGYSRRTLIAASLSFLLVGSGLGLLARPGREVRDDNQHIRDLEARYMSLYSAETLADVDSAPAILQRGLDRTRLDIGLTLNQQQLALRGAELKMVRILRYETTSIAQIAWLHADYGPMALCISPAGGRSAGELQEEARHGMRLAWWQRSGYQFVLIGRNPASQLAAAAQDLQIALS